MKIDLNDLERKAFGAAVQMSRLIGDDAGEFFTNSPMTTVALIARVRELEAALGKAAIEVEHHSWEYQHVTPPRVRSAWRILIEKGVRVAFEGTLWRVHEVEHDSESVSEGVVVLDCEVRRAAVKP